MLAGVTDRTHFPSLTGASRNIAAWSVRPGEPDRTDASIRKSQIGLEPLRGLRTVLESSIALASTFCKTNKIIFFPQGIIRRVQGLEAIIQHSIALASTFCKTNKRRFFPKS